MTIRFATDQYKPYPEIVERRGRDDPYDIIDTTDKDWLPANGMADKVRRRLFVPLNRGGRSVTRHEMAHVRWSPTKLPKVSYDVRVLLAVEDARINMGMEDKSLPVHLSAGDRGHATHLAAKDLERWDVGTFVLRSIASIGTNVLESILAPGEESLTRADEIALRIVERVRTQLEAARERDGGPVAPFEDAIEIAADVARELDLLGLLNESSRSHPVVLCGTGCCLAGDDVDPEMIRGIVADLEGDDDDAGEGGDGAAAATMSIVEAPLEVRCVVKPGAGHEFRAAHEGSVIRYPGRWFIDGAIFRRQARRRGGSVLIDTSGSMSLSARGVDRILRDAPAVTLVAIYSGRHEEGQLRVIARNGRRATEDHLKPYGSGNIVDENALEWLAKQPEPRVWISDGRVTGVGDTSRPKIRDRCRRLCMRSRIARVRHAEDAARVLEGRRRRESLPPIPGARGR